MLRCIKLRPEVLKRCFSSAASQPKIHLTMFTKKNCMLCYQADEVLRQALAKSHNKNFELEKIDISEPKNEKWFGMYRYDVPVLNIEREGYEAVEFKHRFDLEELIDEIDEKM